MQNTSYNFIKKNNLAHIPAAKYCNRPDQVQLQVTKVRLRGAVPLQRTHGLNLYLAFMSHAFLTKITHTVCSGWLPMANHRRSKHS